jgi:hypothetical protein
MGDVEERRQRDREDSGYDGPERRRSRSRRFIDRYEQRRRARQRGEVAPFVRPFRIFAGVALVLAGVAIGWLPGPGFVILALPGAFLIASEIRWMARAMDRGEHVTIPRVKRAWARLRGGPKQSWIDADPALWLDWTHPDWVDTSEDDQRDPDTTRR